MFELLYSTANHNHKSTMVSFNLSDHHHLKRKRFLHAVEEEDEDDDQVISESTASSQRAKTINSLLGIELPLLTPLPLEWQRCLDIKSGQVYFYNTRTQEKTSRDPRLRRREPPANLDLELNLLCGSSERHVGDNFSEMTTKVSVGIRTRDDQLTASKNSYGGGRKKRRGVFLSLARSPSWLTFDGDGDDDEEEEMVTAVCKECHMLVMLCKTAPTCPNCKKVSLPAASLGHMWSADQAPVHTC